MIAVMITLITLGYINIYLYFTLRS